MVELIEIAEKLTTNEHRYFSTNDDPYNIGISFHYKSLKIHYIFNSDAEDEFEDNTLEQLEMHGLLDKIKRISKDHLEAKDIGSYDYFCKVEYIDSLYRPVPQFKFELKTENM